MTASDKDWIDWRWLVGMVSGGLVVGALIVGLAFVGNRSESRNLVAPSRSNAPFDIAGYRFIKSLGAPVIPNQPVDVLVDDTGRTFVADLGLGRVLAYDAEHHLDNSWGQAGMSAELPFTARIALDEEGRLFVLQIGGPAVVALNNSGQVIPGFGLEATAENSPIPAPTDLAIDARDRLLITDLRPGAVNLFNRQGQELDTWNLDGLEPYGITIDSRNRVLVSYTNSSNDQAGIRVYDLDGNLLDDWDLTEYTAGRGQQLPTTLTVAGEDQVVILLQPRAVDAPPRFIKLDSAGTHPQDVDIDLPNLALVNGLIAPGLDIDADEHIYLARPQYQRVGIFDGYGSHVADLAGELADDRFVELSAITLDTEDRLYAVDPVTRRVIEYEHDRPAKLFSLSGEDVPGLAFGVSTGFLRERSVVAVDADGFVYLRDRPILRVFKFAPDGELLQENWGPTNPLADELIEPSVMAADAEGRILVVDQQEANTVHLYDADGAALGTLFEPFSSGAITDLAVTSDAIFTLEQSSDSSVVRKFDYDGNYIGDLIDLQAGDGNVGRTGQNITANDTGDVLVTTGTINPGPSFEFSLLRIHPNGSATELGQLDAPITTLSDIEITANGTLYIATPNDRRIYVYEPIR